MLFLDGVGIGKRDPSINPFFAAELPGLRWLFDGEVPSAHNRFLSSSVATLIPLDATLGVKGLPQSGTGQTALFAGVNGPEIVGRHFGPYPYSTLRPIIQEKNIFRRLLDAGKHPCFANAFPERFFEYMRQKRSRLSVTTLSCTLTGIPLMGVEDLLLGRAVSADITNAGWPELGHPQVAAIEPEEAGRRLVRLVERNDFVLFEYWRTDQAGHSRRMPEAIIEALDVRSTLLVITSDHGNIEDMSAKTHTRNSVPAILYGRSHSELAGRLGRGASLMDVTPALMEFLTAG
jgi:hypothetical protein